MQRYIRSSVSRRQSFQQTAKQRFATERKDRITLALYRQLIDWSKSVEDDVPLSYFIPPVHLSPPQVDKKSLYLMAIGDKESRVKASLFPERTIVEENQLTIPIRNSSDVRKFFRGVFRLNAVSTNPDKQKQRISLAFEGLKSLNELSQALADLKEKRRKHIDRDDVRFRVGQVVRHKVEEWRAVIIGWEHSDSDDEPSLGAPPATSLTQKNYPLDPSDGVKYTLILDSGDAHLHYSKRRESNNLSMTECFESDLEEVKDKSLLRIRSSYTPEYFKRYDTESNNFIPNEIMAYEFPADDMQNHSQLKLSVKSEHASEQIISGVQEAANHLRKTILGYTSAPESRKMKLLGLFLDRLTSLSEGDVLDAKDRLSTEPFPSNKIASMHLQQLLNATVNIGDLLWQKRRNKENEKKIKFELGDIVKHKLYGFRGVVVAWDPEPTLDVSRWDGLSHIKNPDEFPFYQIIPDQNDCLQAFGGERSSRYVCEENLEICSKEERNVDIDLEPEWKHNQSEGLFYPPDDLKFKYGEGLSDDRVIEQCLTEIKDCLSQIFVASRDGSSTGKSELDSIAKQLALNNLLEVLGSANDMKVATIVSESLKEVWKAHLDNELRWKLDTAVAYLLSGKVSQALQNFSEVVDEDPYYAEAWNKASTCEFMMGNMDASLAAAQKTIECLPTHFQALNGLGLVYYEKKDVTSAIDCFRKSMDIDPWSPVSARLSVCLDTLKTAKEFEAGEDQNDP